MFFLSSDKSFYELFDKVGQNAVETAELFLEMLKTWDKRKDYVIRIHQNEHKGDQLTHETITKLDQTFITPFDREDIHDLIKEADDVVDRLDSATKRIVLYGVPEPNEDILKQAEIAVQTTKSLQKAMQKLRDVKQQTDLHSAVLEIHDWENRGDDHVQAALARLFETNDPMHVLKWKEIYELVEKAIDACETVANTIRSIMVKNA